MAFCVRSDSARASIRRITSSYCANAGSAQSIARARRIYIFSVAHTRRPTSRVSIMEQMKRFVVLALLGAAGVCSAASPLAVGPRRYLGPDLEESRRPGRLSLPSRHSVLRAAPVHRLAEATRDELRME